MNLRLVDSSASSSPLAAILSLLLASSAFLPPSFTAEAKSDEGYASPVPLILPDESEPTVSLPNGRPGRASSLTGAPVSLYRVGHRVAGGAVRGNPRATAEKYLKEKASQLRLGRPSDLGDLEHAFTRTGPAGTVARFRQTAGGVPVYGAEIAVSMNNDGDIVHLSSSYKPPGSGDSGVNPFGGLSTTKPPDVPPADAARAARAYLEVERADLSHESIRLVAYPMLRGRGNSPVPTSVLAYEVRMVPSEFPIGDYEVLVDANTGDIFKVDDKTHNAVGNVFMPDPLTSSGASYCDPGYCDNGDGVTPEITSQTISETLQGLTFDGTNYQLKGPFAEIVDTESPRNGLFSQPSSTFAFDRSQSGFEAVNVYYHVDAVMRWLNVDLGLGITPYQYSGGARFDPHGLNGDDNSHYTSGNGVIAFGEGGVDDAECTDVVVHELGHALHDWVTGGGLSQVNGLSEGTGDYIAQSYSRSLASYQWTPTDPQYNWVFKWDGHNQFWDGRRTDYAATYPGGLVGSVHADGQIWSSCNMRIWEALGRVKTDTAFWSGLGMTGGNSNQEDSAQAVLTAAVDLGYDRSDVSTIQTIYRECGYAVSAPCASTCGDGVVECDETCDGAAPDGETCATYGCTGGALSCDADNCGGVDLSACLDCPPCNDDGVCDIGEDCGGCPGDCVGGATSGAVCGNGICEAGDGEDCVVCPQDCNGVTNGKPGDRYCCGDGDGENPLPCSDSTCTAGGNTCTDTQVVPGSFCCGDGRCDAGESCSNCAVDCATSSAEICGNGVDDNCDGITDCADASTCSGHISCQVSQCNAVGSLCTQGSDCCSNKCKGNPLTCK